MIETFPKLVAMKDGKQIPVLIHGIDATPDGLVVIDWELDFTSPILSGMIQRIMTEEGESIPQSAISSEQLKALKEEVNESLSADFITFLKNQVDNDRSDQSTILNT